jgi:hypothetical protein
MDAVGPDVQRESSAWQRAASALERHDVAEADRALAELTRAGDSATRDAARLARAQLWTSHGDRARAEPVLRELARHGATGIIRKRARDLLQE